ncbi:MAG: disulfide bond formation protein B [Alphaproteobacteria bacterium]|nr:MAG: disulfide bond formation protein B [Alphaproteobacteria bacterium]
MPNLPYGTRLGLAAALGSLFLLGGAYYFQYVVGLAPCDMCLWQRYPHMLAILFGLLTLPLLVEPKVALVFALVAVMALFTTSGIGVYHAGVEQHWWQGPQSCTGRVPAGLSAEELKQYLMGARMVRCDEIPWKMWKISMAGWNAILSGLLAIGLSLSVLNHIRDRP